MITVFNGKSFGLSGERSSGFVQIDRLLVDHIASFTPSGFVVFMAIVMHVDNNGYCWPSVKRLVECTGLSETTVKTALHYLTGMRINDKRILAINPRTSPSGRTSSNGYKLFPDSIDHASERTVVTAGSTKTEKAKEEDPAYPLYKTFKQARYGFVPEAPITDKEWKDVRLTIWQMHKAGITQQDVEQRTLLLLKKWTNQDMVTVRSLWKHWDSHANPLFGKPINVSTGLLVNAEGWFDDDNG